MYENNPNCGLQESKFAYFRIRPLQHIEQKSNMTLTSSLEEYQFLPNLQTDLHFVHPGDRINHHIHGARQLQPPDKIKKIQTPVNRFKFGSHISTKYGFRAKFCKFQNAKIQHTATRLMHFKKIKHFANLTEWFSKKLPNGYTSIT